MLAETFEDPRMKFIAEKVCHNPVVLAYHAEGEGWELYATSSGKTKFWGMTKVITMFRPIFTRILLSGKSLEIIPQGSIHLKIGQDHFVWYSVFPCRINDCSFIRFAGLVLLLS